MTQFGLHLQARSSAVTNARVYPLKSTMLHEKQHEIGYINVLDNIPASSM